MRVLACCPGNVRTELFERAGFDPAEVARMAMLAPEEVVEASLAALARGDVVCVPGERRRDAWLRRLLPRRGLARVAGVLERLG